MMNEFDRIYLDAGLLEEGFELAKFISKNEEALTKVGSALIIPKVLQLALLYSSFNEAMNNATASYLPPQTDLFNLEGNEKNEARILKDFVQSRLASELLSYSHEYSQLVLTTDEKFAENVIDLNRVTHGNGKKISTGYIRDGEVHLYEF